MISWVIENWISCWLFCADSSSEISFFCVSVWLHWVSKKTISSFIIEIKLFLFALFSNWSSKYGTLPFLIISLDVLCIMEFISTYLNLLWTRSKHSWSTEGTIFSYFDLFDHCRLLYNLWSLLGSEDIWVLVWLSGSCWSKRLVNKLSLSNTLWVKVVGLLFCWLNEGKGRLVSWIHPNCGLSLIHKHILYLKF